MSHPIDLVNDYLDKQALASQAVTASGNGSALDFANCGPGLKIQVNNGTSSGTSPTLALKLQESQNANAIDASGEADAWADISGATLSLTSADDGTVINLQVNNRSKRWVRLVRTIGGSNTPTFNIGVVVSGKKIIL